MREVQNKAVSGFTGVSVSPDFSDFGVIIAAAGSAVRFGGSRNKLLCNLRGVPVICYALRTFLSLVPASRVVVVLPPGLESEFRLAFRRGGLDPDMVQCVAGGRRRQDSVVNGLRSLSPELNLVAVQDAARPWTSSELVAACTVSARQHGSGVAARRVIDTVKLAEPSGQVRQTLDRNLLWAAETPQVFERQILEAAYRNLFERQIEVTDDAQAVELSGFPVFLVEHRGNNGKITFASDIDG